GGIGLSGCKVPRPLPSGTMHRQDGAKCHDLQGQKAHRGDSSRYGRDTVIRLGDAVTICWLISDSRVGDDGVLSKRPGPCTISVKVLDRIV
ncbi:hypothetical protein BaRGS_00014348, partial [Batillaria attramentaria]